MNVKALLIKQGCDEALANEKLMPKDDGTTYCNIGVMLVAEKYGYPDFLGKTANHIYDHAYKSNLWRIVTGEEAQRATLEGCLSLAAQKAQGHGHVAVIYPTANKVYSGKWQKEVPFVANIGKQNRLVSVNFAFATEPQYFSLRHDWHEMV